MLEDVGSILRDYHSAHGIVVNKTGQSRSEHSPVRTRLLHRFLEERGVVDQINIFEADISTERIVALVQKYKGQTTPYSGILDVANIYYAKNQNYCWRRFGVCKEMYHCMIDRTDTDRVASLDSLQTLLELLSADTSAITGEFAPLNREQEAELKALETLFPVEYRQAYISNPIKNPEEYSHLARAFRIPLEYARLACQPNYVKTVTQLRGRLLDLN